VFQETSERLVKWASDTVGEAIATLTPPADAPTGRGVGLHLLDLEPQPPPRGVRQPRLHVTLRYLITAWAETAAEAQRLLGTLTFAAMQQPDLDLDRTPPPLALWQAFGVPPQPCLVVRCQAWTDIPARPVKIAKKAVFETTVARHLAGRVIAASGAPVADATIEAPEYRLEAQTGSRGEFQLPAMPDSSRVRLVVRSARGEETVDVTPPSIAGDPLVIQLQKQE
jgi:hypothetical protein